MNTGSHVPRVRSNKFHTYRCQCWDEIVCRSRLLWAQVGDAGYVFSTAAETDHRRSSAILSADSNPPRRRHDHPAGHAPPPPRSAQTRRPTTPQLRGTRPSRSARLPSTQRCSRVRPVSNRARHPRTGTKPSSSTCTMATRPRRGRRTRSCGLMPIEERDSSAVVTPACPYCQ